MWCCVWCEYVIEAERVMCAAAQTSDSDLKANMRRSVARSVENRAACSQLSLHVWSTCIFVAHHGFCKVFDEKLWKPCVVPIQPVLPSQYAYLSFSTKAHFPLKAHLSFSNQSTIQSTHGAPLLCAMVFVSNFRNRCAYFSFMKSHRFASHSILYIIMPSSVMMCLYTYTLILPLLYRKRASALWCSILVGQVRWMCNVKHNWNDKIYYQHSNNVFMLLVRITLLVCS